MVGLGDACLSQMAVGYRKFLNWKQILLGEMHIHREFRRVIINTYAHFFSFGKQGIRIFIIINSKCINIVT